MMDRNLDFLRVIETVSFTPFSLTEGGSQVQRLLNCRGKRRIFSIELIIVLFMVHGSVIFLI